MGIKTAAFVTELVKSFHGKISNTDVYFVGSDYNLSSNTTNSNQSLKDVLERSIFGQKIGEDDVSYMINRNIWAPNIVYDIYDDMADVSSSNFYVITEPEDETDTNHHVWKCLFNNNGNPSTSKPQYNEDIIETGGESNVADGYIWKYMFSVTPALVSKFRTTNFFPLTTNEFVANSAVNGLDVILVENFQTNYGYEKVDALANTTYDAGRVSLAVSPNTVFNTADNTYKQSVAFFNRGDESTGIEAAVFTIVNSGVISGTPYINIDQNEYAASLYDIELNDRVEILPGVKIEGTGTGAVAIAIFDETYTRINSIKMLSKGSGYTAATATIVKPEYVNYVTGDIEALLRPIISPIGGHGADPVKELRSAAICISNVIKTQIGSVIPGSGDYSKIALVFEPDFVTRNADGSPDDDATPPETYFNAVRLTGSGTLPVAGDEVFQSNGAKGIVHSVDGNYIYVINFATGNSVRFTIDLPLGIGSTSINISNVTYPSYLERSGEVLYISDFQPITRDDEKEELVKILIDF